MLKKLSLLLSTIALVALILPVAACNTVEGFGRDVKSAGESMSNAANKAKD